MAMLIHHGERSRIANSEFLAIENFISHPVTTLPKSPGARMHASAGAGAAIPATGGVRRSGVAVLERAAVPGV